MFGVVVCVGGCLCGEDVVVYELVCWEFVDRVVYECIEDRHVGCD